MPQQQQQQQLITLGQIALRSILRWCPNELLNWSVNGHTSSTVKKRSVQLVTVVTVRSEVGEGVIKTWLWGLFVDQTNAQYMLES